LKTINNKHTQIIGLLLCSGLIIAVCYSLTGYAYVPTHNKAKNTNAKQSSAGIFSPYFYKNVWQMCSGY